jgi:hypothetical protein
MAYLIIIVCGTMGSPAAIKFNTVDCGLINNCTLSSKDLYDESNFFLWR